MAAAAVVAVVATPVVAMVVVVVASQSCCTRYLCRVDRTPIAVVVITVYVCTWTPVCGEPHQRWCVCV